MMKKFTKGLMMAVVVFALTGTGTTLERAEAAMCPPHGEYYDTVLTGRNVGYMHRVKREIYALDEYGNMINLSELTGDYYYEECIVKFEEFDVIVRCKKCHSEIGSYRYATPEMHSFCAVG